MDTLITWIKSNRILSWIIFWFGWFWISPETIVPGSLAFMIGYVFYRERALNLVSVCATYLGILGYLVLGHIATDWPEQVRLYMGLAGFFSILVLGMRYRMFGYFLIIMLLSAFSRGRYYGPYYYGRRRWW